MKTTLAIAAMALLLPALVLPAATNDLTSSIQRGLFEEEANQNLGAAIQAYQTVASQFDKDRKLAATAIFRLGECYRKQDNTNDAAMQYERILREFSDQPTLVTLSRQNLAALGSAPAAPATPVLSEAARKEQKRLLEEEIKLAEKQLESQQKQMQVGAANSDSVIPFQRELLKLKQQVAALDAGQPLSAASADAAASAAATAESDLLTLEAQLATLKSLPKDKARIVLQQDYPNSALHTLMAELGAEERKLAALQRSYGPDHPEVQQSKAKLETLDKQIDAQVAGELKGLELKRDVAASVAKRFQAQAGAAASQGKEPSSSAASALATTTEADEVRHIQALIKDSPDLINAPDRKGETLLQSAAAKGKLAVVKLLLDSGAAVGGPQQPGLTALHYAAANGHKAVLDLLLSRGAKADAQTANGTTPLHLAARKGYEAVAKTLLAAGAPVNAPTTQTDGTDREDLQYTVGWGQTPLHVAAIAGYGNLVELLLAKGADPNVADGKGRTALSYAVQFHYQPVVQLLLAAHANPNAGSSDLPLTAAAYHGDLPPLKLLLANGADPNISTNLSSDFRGIYGMPGQGGAATPLAAAVSQKHPDAVAELLRAKADPNGAASDGVPLIFGAIWDDPTLRALLEGGAEPNRLTPERPSNGMPGGQESGVTPLYQAVLNGKLPAVELLLAHHAEVNCTNKGGETPLHMAALGGSKDIAELVLKAGANVNAKDSGGWTPLHLAVSRDQREMVELLLAHNADPNERKKDGQTPLDLAKGLAQQQNVRPAASWQEQEAKAKAMAGLLRQHGALDNLPQLDRITVRRSATGYSNTQITKGTHDWSQFTLLELLAVQYKLLAASPSETGHSVSYLGLFFSESRLPFPDLAHVHISRPANDLKSWQDQVVDLRPVLEAGDCAKDVRLSWGDVVEIPEADHPLNETWRGFSRPELENLKKCLTRQVEVLVKGQATNITLAPQVSLRGLPPRQNVEISYPTPFWLKPVLLQSKLVLVSSDLSHVKVTRRDPATGQNREWVVDCSEAGPAPDFWLKDGDRIEVPEKSYSGAATAPPQSQEVNTGANPISTASASGSAPLSYQWRRNRTGSTNAAQAGTPRAAAPGMALPSPPGQPVPPPGPAEQVRPATVQRLANVIERLPPAEPPEDDKGHYLIVGSLWYSPKADDSRLLKAGYHKDRSAKTRQAEIWQECATPELTGRGGNTAVWTGHDLIVFGGEGPGTSYGDGARYSLAEDTWALLPQKGKPSSRTGHAAVWTGKEMIVWGGFGGTNGNNVNHNDGARYNPSTDTWKPVASKNAPAARFDFPAVWTGREMLLWGGYTDSNSRYQGGHADAHLNTGGRYSPSSDAWKSMTPQGAPSKRNAHAQVWTGTEMIIWGGANAATVLNDGGRYNPSRDAWRPVSTEGAPSPRCGHVAVWTGREMIIWGGTTREPQASSDYFVNGGRYDPATDSWKPISTIGAPQGRALTCAVWTGTEMVVWGGVNDAQAGAFPDNARPNSVSDPFGLGVKPPSQDQMQEHKKLMDQYHMLVDPAWHPPTLPTLNTASGQIDRYVGTGGRYNPATDTWKEITTTAAPSPRLASGVWVGDGLLLFGGYNGMHLNETWLYSPAHTLYPYAKQ